MLVPYDLLSDPVNLAQNPKHIHMLFQNQFAELGFQPMRSSLRPCRPGQINEA